MLLQLALYVFLCSLLYHRPFVKALLIQKDYVAVAVLAYLFKFNFCEEKMQILSRDHYA